MREPKMERKGEVKLDPDKLFQILSHMYGEDMAVEIMHRKLGFAEVDLEEIKK